jgi:O-antigen/teichoic acid export membrane protein
MISYLWLSPWRGKGRYNIREAFGVVTYGLQVTSSRIFWYIYMNADKVIIGKFLGDRALGFYSFAFSIATLPSNQVTTLATNVAAPVISKLQFDKPKLITAVLSLTRGVAYFTYPALIGMFACSRELIPVALGDKWIESLLPFGALCLMGLVKTVDPLLSQVLIGVGQAKKLSVYTLTCGIVMSLAVCAGALTDGLRGVSIAWLVTYPILSVILLNDVCRAIGMTKFQYYRNLIPVLSGTLAMAAVVAVVREVTLLMGLHAAVMLVFEIAAGAASYLLWIVYMDKQGLKEIRQVMLDLGVAEQKLERWPFNRVALT